jgi:putative FmdB family regulatory protein
MPNYDFICDECETERVVYISINFEQVVYCQTCKLQMRKMIQPTPNIRVKGISRK